MDLRSQASPFNKTSLAAQQRSEVQSPGPPARNVLTPLPKAIFSASSAPKTLPKSAEVLRLAGAAEAIPRIAVPFIVRQAILSSFEKTITPIQKNDYTD
jgi:hypothetical protein